MDTTKQEQVVIPQTTAALFSYRAMKSAALRPAMWVVCAEGVGVLTACTPDGRATVTLAKADGSTKMVLSADDKAVPAVFTAATSEIRQATHDEIPETRRPADDVSVRLGYTTGGAA